MVTVIIFNSGVVATKKTNMPCCGTYLDLALISFSGLIQPYIYNDVRIVITYERPLPAGCVFTCERSERKATRSMRRVAMFDRRTHPGASIDYGVISCERIVSVSALFFGELKRAILHTHASFRYRGGSHIPYEITSSLITTQGANYCTVSGERSEPVQLRNTF